MAVFGEVFKLIQKWERSGQEWYNVYHYQVLSVIDGSGSGAMDLVLAFQSDVQPVLLGIISEFVDIAQYECQSLTTPTDYYVDTTIIPNSGLVTGSEALPEQWTATFKCFRPYPPLRNGYKRFGGVAESVVSGDNIAAAFVTVVDDISNALGSDIASAAPDYTFRPVIVPGEYEDGSTPAPWRANRWSFARMGTQRTRMPA